MDIHDNAMELLKTGNDIKVNVTILPESEAQDYIHRALLKFSPERTWGHLCIGKDSIKL